MIYIFSVRLLWKILLAKKTLMRDLLPRSVYLIYKAFKTKIICTLVNSSLQHLSKDRSPFKNTNLDSDRNVHKIDERNLQAFNAASLAIATEKPPRWERR